MQNDGVQVPQESSASQPAQVRMDNKEHQPAHGGAGVLADGVKQTKQRKELWFKKSLALYVAALTLFILLHISGIYLFTSGFLLTRFVLDNKSQCSAPPISAAPGSPRLGTIESGCWHPKKFKKAVVILVDALRYDFTIPFQPTQDDPKPHYFHDSFPTLYELASSQPHNAFLLPFIADPPTTTLQRLKALTTGTLPTFIEAGSNFAGTAIDEDSIVRQLYAANKTVVHLGDDTWHSLFPGLFDAELTKPFDSFDAWDLHTVDNGVSQYLFPLLQKSNHSKWDVIFGHYLGVDHAGHTHGPDHPAMTAKLQQMDDVCRRIIDLIDDSTLLVFMGDHGMDFKGDHGGESSDEKEAALWMYSKAGVFGRTSPDHVLPPATAKERPVNQIDLVPTLSLLLGIPIPFGNLGAPIREAFIGSKGSDYENLATVNRLTGAQIERYLGEYTLAQDLDENDMGVPWSLWDSATRDWEKRVSAGKAKQHQWESLAGSFLSYQTYTLEVFRSLWTQFDLISMCLGISIQVGTLVVLLFYARGLKASSPGFQWTLLLRGYIGLAIGLVAGIGAATMFPMLGLPRSASFAGASCCLLGMGSAFISHRKVTTAPYPRSFWGWSCFMIPLLLSAGFGANSFTIWEDEILLFFLAFAGTAMLASSFRLRDPKDRSLGMFYSIVFMIVVRLGSLSRVCREEQLQDCKSTFYATATALPWQLIVPYILAIALPNIIRAYYQQTFSYHGSAVSWIGFAFRIGLLLNAVYWTIDVADDGKWFDVRAGLLKTIRTHLAQIILAVNLAAGSATFAWSAPFIGVERTLLPTTPTPSPKSPRAPKASNGTAHSKAKPSASPTQPFVDEPAKAQVVVRGTNNLYGSHFTIIPLTMLLLPLLVLSKPMGQAALALLTVAILSLLELLHLLHLSPSSTTAHRLSNSAVGPTILALLAHHTFFKTGHQATLTSIQWNAAFIALNTTSYPLAPLYIILNTFSAQVLCAAAVPCLVLWRRKLPANLRWGSKAAAARRANNDDDDAVKPNPADAVLAELARAIATFVLVFALVSAATTVEVAWLRRHLMLYRVFMPRWALGCVVLVLVEVVAVFVGLLAVGWTMVAVGGVFGWG